jgi:hypothetical protein
LKFRQVARLEELEERLWYMDCESCCCNFVFYSTSDLSANWWGPKCPSLVILSGKSLFVQHAVTIQLA